MAMPDSSSMSKSTDPPSNFSSSQRMACKSIAPDAEPIRRAVNVPGKLSSLLKPAKIVCFNNMTVHLCQASPYPTLKNFKQKDCIIQIKCYDFNMYTILQGPSLLDFDNFLAYLIPQAILICKKKYLIAVT